jgi:hypothetical protein
VIRKVGNQEFVAEAFRVTPAPEQSQYAFHLGSAMNHEFTRRNQARNDRAVKFGPISIYGGIDGIEHFDTKQRSLWQAVYAITAGGVKPSVEIKRQDGSCRDVHGFNAGRLTTSGTCECADERQSH